jgi:hypothetical protein
LRTSKTCLSFSQMTVARIFIERSPRSCSRHTPFYLPCKLMSGRLYKKFRENGVSTGTKKSHTSTAMNELSPASSTE